jgi:photosystem II stability/assembly factor-like uncharacterized protein
VPARGLPLKHCTCVAARDDVVLAGTVDGVFRSEDTGKNWREANDGLSVRHARWLAFHPEIAGLAFLGTEPAAIFVSHDGGEKWRECPEVAHLRDSMEWYLPYSPEAGCVRGFAFYGSRGYAAVEQGGLLRTDDTGQTWRLAEGSTGDPKGRLPPHFIHNDVHSVVVHPSSPDLVFVPTAAGLYRSLDGGKSWASLYDCYCRAVWADPADASHLVFGPADGVDRYGRIAESRDGGMTWTPALGPIGAPWPQHMVERIVQVGDALIAVLSNGQLLTAPLATMEWRGFLERMGKVTAVAVMEKPLVPPPPEAAPPA